MSQEEGGTIPMHEGTAPQQRLNSRMEKIRLVTEQGFIKSEEEKQQILKARARALARVPKKKEASDYIEIVEFQLVNERYGIEPKYVAEVHPLRQLTPVPCTPDFVLGIVNLRGRIISVIDLKKFFNLPDQGFSTLNRLIVLESKAMEFGLLADLVVGRRIVHRKDIQPPLPTLTAIDIEYLAGITGEDLIILDGGKLLADQQIVVHETV